MIGIGTLINTAAVIGGGLIGVTLKRGIPEKHSNILMQACGVATIFIGASGVLEKIHHPRSLSFWRFHECRADC